MYRHQKLATEESLRWHIFLGGKNKHLVFQGFIHENVGGRCGAWLMVVHPLHSD